MSEKKMDLNEMPNNQSRRKALKKIAVGVGALTGYSVLPQKWTQPIIDNIVLPAHAQTSGVTAANQLTLSLLSGDQSSEVVSIGIDGQVYPPTANQQLDITIEGSYGTAEAMPEKNEGGINKVLAAAGSFFVSEAIAKPHCEKHKIKAVTGADGKFHGKCDLACGPGLMYVFVYVIILDMPMSPITGSIYIPITGDPTTTDAPTTTCNPCNNNPSNPNPTHPIDLDTPIDSI
jgi:hypothetical protein